MPQYEAVYLGRQLARQDGADAVPGEIGIGLDDRLGRYPLDLSPIGQVDVCYQRIHSQQGFDLTHALLAGGIQGEFLLAGGQLSGLPFQLFLMLDSPAYRGQTEFPFRHHLGILQVPRRTKLGQMPIPRRRDEPVPTEKIEGDTAFGGEVIVLPMLAILFAEAVLVILIDEFFIDGEKIQALIGCRIEPGKMIEAEDVDLDLFPGNPVHAAHILQHLRQELLRAKDFMTTAKGLYPGEYLV